MCPDHIAPVEFSTSLISVDLTLTASRISITLTSDISHRKTSPDISADPQRFGVISGDMQPGDCVAFNNRTMHDGSGKLAENIGLRVFTTKWLGDDVHVNFREHGMDPDHSEVMTEVGLKPGDRPGTDLYPMVWPKE
ncbi:MAG: hypothetical protein ACI8XC_000965 [Gammaproteobacteria bacterium]